MRTLSFFTIHLKHRIPQKPAFLGRLVIVILVLLAGAFLAPSAALGRKWAILLFLLIPASFGIIILQRWPISAYTGLIITSMIIPFSIGTGSQTNINATVILLSLLIAMWIGEMFFRKRVYLIPSRPVRPLLLFIIVVLLSFGFGQLSWFGVSGAPIRAQFGELMIYLLSIGAYLLISQKIQQVKILEWMTWVFLTLGGLYIMGQLISPLGRVLDYFIVPGSTGCLFWTWMVALAFAQAVFNKNLGIGLRSTLVVLLLSAAYISIGVHLDWTSGWAPPLVAVGAILWIGAPRLRLPMILVAIGMLLNINKITSTVMVGDNEYSLYTRLAAWNTLINVIKANPVLGLGPANYYWYTPLFDILGYHIRFNSHNNYVDILAQTGLLGLSCFLWFAGETWRLGWQLRNKVSNGFEKAYIYAVLGGLLGTLAAGMFGDWILPFVYNIGYEGFRASVLGWLFLGGLGVIENLYTQKQFIFTTKITE